MNQTSNVAFIISSVIYFTQKPLSYTPQRSIYSPLERTKQTLKTIESIHEKIPTAKIILIESGQKEELPLKLSKAVDQYIYTGDNWLVRKACDSKHKGLGEALSLIMGSKKINMNDDVGFYFKISGRYFLNDNFDLQEINNCDGIFLKYDKSISTRLYGFTRKVFANWRIALIKSLPFLMFNKSIEDILPKFFKLNNFKYLKKMGISGYVGPNGHLIEE